MSIAISALLCALLVASPLVDRCLPLDTLVSLWAPVVHYGAHFLISGHLSQSAIQRITLPGVAALQQASVSSAIADALSHLPLHNQYLSQISLQLVN